MTDRDKLIELLKKADNNASQKLIMDYDDAIADNAEYLLANGVKIEKQGEWKQTTEPLGWRDVDCVECSACGETWIIDEDLDLEQCVQGWNYCPNCGAKMKELNKNAKR